MVSKMQPGRDNIVLIGFMGAGKTSLGKAVSKSLGVSFLDTDDLIEQSEGKTISEIFAEKGRSISAGWRHRPCKAPWQRTGTEDLCSPWEADFPLGRKPAASS